MENTQTQNIQWKQMASLIALYASVIIGWIAYHRYQPALLETFGLTKYGYFLVWAQALILIITPPIAGYLGDKYRARLGNRLRIITLGVSFAAMIFMTVAFTLIINPPEEFVYYALPVLVILWLFAMSLFTSPAISMVELFSPSKSLPITVAALTITSDLLYSLEPVIVEIIDYLGGALTFATGGIIVSLSGYFLNKYSTTTFDGLKEKRPDDKKPDFNATKVLIIGAALGVVSGTVIEIFPEYLDRLNGLTGISGKWLVSVLLAITAIFSLPASKFVQDKNLNTQMTLFWVLTMLSLGGVFLIDNQIVMVVLLVIFAIFYAFLNVCSLPLALRNTSIQHKVLGVGVFFCGFEIPNGIIDILAF